MTTLFLAILTVALWLAVFLVIPVVSAWRRWQSTRIVTCPENWHPAAVEMDMRYAVVGSIAGRPELRLRDCSRWPERSSCGQVCLAEIEESPESCLVRPEGPGAGPPST